MNSSPQHAPSAGAELALATAAFTVSFFAWSLLGPLGPDLQDSVGLSDFQTSTMVAVPVLLGSIMRIPLGWLTDRYGGRRVFSLLLMYTPLPLIALAVWHDSLATIIVFGFLLGFAGASFAVGVPFVNGWYTPERQGSALGIYGAGMGGTVLAGLLAPPIADQWGLSAPFWVAAGLVAVMAAVFWVKARDAARTGPRDPAPGMFAALSVFRTSGRAWALTLFYFLAFGGFVAMFLYLPKLPPPNTTSRRPTPARAPPASRSWRSSAGPWAVGSPTASVPPMCCWPASLPWACSPSSSPWHTPRCHRSPSPA